MCHKKLEKENFIEMAEGATSLKELRAQMAASAQAQAEERRSLAGNSPVPASPATANTPPSTTAAKSPRPVIDGAALRIDDRLRVAKERREEADRQQAAKDSQILERERKAKLQVERQMEERQKKLDEQRRKEEQRRSAVEEKRKQKQEEEKEHYEAVMRRTLERSQRVEQRQKRWSWGGLSESDNRSVDKRSTSTMNLKQLSEASINKRLSSSSATLINSPDKKCHLCPRSASASPLHPVQRGPLRSRSIDRQKSATLPTSASADQVDPSLKEKRFSSPGGKRPASPSNIAGRHRSPSPAPLPASKRTPSPSAKPSPRNRPSSPGGIKHRPSSPQFSSAKPPSPQPTSAKPPPIQRPALTPTGPPTLRKRDSKPKDLCPIQPVVPQSSEAPQASTTPTPTHTTSSKTKDKDDKSMAGTNSAAEAAMILAENRRLAREKKEREEALRVLREEEEKLRKEEDKRLAEEDRLKRLEEEKRLAEERKKKEEEDALMAEADRERLEVEEAVRQAELQKEREEAEAQAAIEAEKVRIERERVMAQNQQERMERKKRIEEIMKRTRKGDLEKRDYDEGDEEGDEEEAKDDESAQTGDVAMETDCMDEGRGLTRSEPMGERREPLGSVNWKPEADDKENNNGTSAEEPLAVNPVPKGRLVEGSEFLNEDSNKLAPGLNGKPGPWSFEELIDLGVNSKGRPLIDAEGRNQGLIDCDGGPEGPRVAFEDKGIPVATLHPSSQPIEALSEM
ncbi:MAP7 domain-containing protein 2 isoform X13 [Oncorhynchus tshawytscha]|uniref:MAP7 domain-containing protein 2 isoform X13 n=1 Tax=Oncorhynchus tshawytscha TaxID=74940 RepID=UPI001C3CF60E|nr:MAP7 domain-containing protein 2 isoform X13 [Oncorhynchus tshawytscha]